MFQHNMIVVSEAPPRMGKIRNAAQIRKHLADWANYKQRLPKGVDSVEFYQTLDQADVRSLQLSAVQRIWGVRISDSEDD